MRKRVKYYEGVLGKDLEVTTRHTNTLDINGLQLAVLRQFIHFSHLI